LKYRLIIFDFDGTLADTFPWLTGILEKLAEKYHLVLPAAHELEHMRTRHTRELMEEYNISIWKLFSMSRYVQKNLSQDVHKIQLFPGMEQVLRDLHELGIHLAVVSSNSTENVERVLGPELASLFEMFECGASMFGKSSRFQKVIKKTHVAPEETLCIGDEIRDLEAAHKAGLDFGAVSWGYTLPEALRNHTPQLVFESVADIGSLALEA
jgi:phosphoglycolate phosphatase